MAIVLRCTTRIYNTVSTDRLSWGKDTKPSSSHASCLMERLNLGIGALRRTITSGVMKENAEIIREELRGIDGKYGRFCEEPELPDMPCPFAATLLGISWDVDLSPEFPYLTGSCVHTLPASMGSWEGDNDDGITVIDISDPEDPAYCHVRDATPLNGKEYIQAYYDIPKAGENLEKFKQTIVDSLADIEGERVLGLRALAEAWPTEYKDPSDAEVSTDESVKSTLPALAAMALRLVVLQGIECGDTEVIEEMLWLPGKADIVREVLFKQSPFPDNGVALLRKIVEQDAAKSSSIDLSGADFSDAQVAKTLHGLSNISSLNLSRAPRITAEAVREILSELPHLRRLVVMNCPSIVDDDLVDLLYAQPQLFYSLEALMHPAFLSYDSETWSAEVTFMMPRQFHQPTISGVSRPWISTASVVQGFTDFMQVVINDDPYNVSSGGSSAIAAAFTAGPRAPGRKWGERNITALPRFAQLVSAQRPAWLFIFNYDSYLRQNRGWGFIRFPAAQPTKDPETEEHAPESEENESGTGSNKEDAPAPEKSGDEPDVPQFEVHDLRGFLRILVEEGRPEVPEEAITHAEELTQRLAEGPRGRR